MTDASDGKEGSFTALASFNQTLTEVLAAT